MSAAPEEPLSAPCSLEKGSKGHKLFPASDPPPPTLWSRLSPDFFECDCSSNCGGAGTPLHQHQQSHQAAEASATDSPKATHPTQSASGFESPSLFSPPGSTRSPANQRDLPESPSMSSHHHNTKDPASPSSLPATLSPRSPASSQPTTPKPSEDPKERVSPPSSQGLHSQSVVRTLFQDDPSSSSDAQNINLGDLPIDLDDDMNTDDELDEAAFPPEAPRTDIEEQPRSDQRQERTPSQQSPQKGKEREADPGPAALPMPVFLTGSMKAIEISEAKVNQAKRKFEELEKQQMEGGVDPVPPVVPTKKTRHLGSARRPPQGPASTPFRPFEEASPIDPEELDVEDPGWDAPRTKPEAPPEGAQFMGFQTASKKKVHISEDLVKAFQRRFDEERDLQAAGNLGEPNDLSEEQLVPKFLPSPDTRVRTPLARNSGGFVPPSRRTTPVTPAPPMAPVIVSETPEPKAFAGFSTAKGTKVHISKEAIEREQRKFDLLEREAAANLEVDEPTPASPAPATRPTPFSSSSSSSSAPSPSFSALPRQQPPKTSPTLVPLVAAGAGTPQPRRSQGLSRRVPGSNQPAAKGFKTPSKVAEPRIADTPQQNKGASAKPKQQQADPSKSPAFNGPRSAPKFTHTPLFDLNVAKDARMTLKDAKQKEGNTFGEPGDLVLPSVWHIQGTTAASFRFPPHLFPSALSLTLSESDQKWGWPEAYRDLIAAGANKASVSEEWVANHYRWIVWKLASQERMFPSQFGRSLCEPRTVLSQLLYRYEREVNLAQRSAFKKIAEKDDIAGREMVLCVWEIVDPPPPSADLKSSQSTCLLRLTDGWYSLDARADSHLLSLVQSGKIQVGQKLKIFGAELVGLVDPCPPLEVPAGVFLKLFMNGTRRAPWDAKLGYQRSKRVPSSLESVAMRGGSVPCVDVVVMRRYAMQYLEVLDNGQRVALSEKEKHHHDEQMQSKIEALRAKQARSQSSSSADAEREIEEALEESMQRQRESTPFFKVRLCDYPRGGQEPTPHSRQCIFSIWRPSEDDLAIFSEGKRVQILTMGTGVSAPGEASPVGNGKKSHHLIASNSRLTRWKQLPAAETLLATSPYEPRSRFLFSSPAPPWHQEVDLLGIVLELGELHEFQIGNKWRHRCNLFLLDESEKVAVVCLELPLTEVPQKQFKPKMVVNIMNVQLRNIDEVNNVPIFSWSDCSECLTSPRHQVFRAEKHKLEHWLSTNAYAFSKAQAFARGMLSGLGHQQDPVPPPQPQAVAPQQHPEQPMGLSEKDTLELQQMMKEFQDDDDLSIKEEDFLSPADLVLLVESSKIPAPPPPKSESNLPATRPAPAVPVPAPAVQKLQVKFRTPTQVHPPSAASPSRLSTPHTPLSKGESSSSSSSSPYSLSHPSGSRSSPYSHAPSSASSPSFSGSSFAVVGFVCSVKTNEDTGVTTAEIDDEKTMRFAVLDKGVVNFPPSIWKTLSKVKLRFTLKWGRASEGRSGTMYVSRIEPVDKNSKEAKFFPPNLLRN